jgi:hypothetical protein
MHSEMHKEHFSVGVAVLFSPESNIITAYLSDLYPNLNFRIYDLVTTKF